MYLPSMQDFPPGHGVKGVHSCWQLFWWQTGLFGFISRHSLLLENSILIIKNNHDWLIEQFTKWFHEFQILNSNFSQFFPMIGADLIGSKILENLELLIWNSWKDVVNNSNIEIEQDCKPFSLQGCTQQTTNGIFKSCLKSCVA